jgi:hypothetical protein
MTRPAYGQRADILSEAVAPLSFVKLLAFDLSAASLDAAFGASR